MFDKNKIEESKNDATDGIRDSGMSPNRSLNQIAKAVIYLGDCLRYLADKESVK